MRDSLRRVVGEHVTTDRVLGWTIRRRLFALDGLPTGARPVAWFGYASLIVLLVSLLAFDVADDSNASMIDGQVPLLVAYTACAGFASGWALVLTGAMHARLLVSLSTFTLFTVDAIIIGAPSLVYPALALVALALSSRLSIHLSARARALLVTPAVTGIGWLAILSAYVVAVWILQPQGRALVQALHRTFTFTGIAAYALWMAMACGVIVTAVRVSIPVVRFLRRSVFPRRFQAAAVAVLVVDAAASGLLGFVGKDAAWLINWALSISLSVIALGLWLGRGWSEQRAAILTGLALSALVFTFSLSLVMADRTHVGRGVQAIGVFPPVLLFVLLAADHLLRFGKPARWLDRYAGSATAWSLIYLGVVVLVVGALVFLTNYAPQPDGPISQRWQRTLGALTMGAMFVSSPLYLAWVLWRRSDWWGAAGRESPPE